MGAESHQVAILADGEAPRHPIPRGVFLCAARLVCCDGALLKARTLGREPDFTVGDGDSLDPSLCAALGDRFVRIAEQETNDLEKAFRFVCETYSPRSVAILGAGGLREDHAIGNIFRLPSFAAKVADVAMFTECGRFDAVIGSRTFACSPGDAVSVFAPDAATRAESSGFAWPLVGVDLSPLWAGTLNRTTADSFTVTADRPVLVYRPYTKEEEK